MKKISILAIFIMLPSFCYSAWSEYDRGTGNVDITLSTVTTRVRNIIDDPNSENGTIRYSSATIYDLINTANRMFCINTKSLQAFATQQLTAGTTEYLLPDDMLYLERVTLNRHDGNGPSFIPQKTVWGLDLEQTDWAVETSSPTSYYLRNRYIGLYPFPQYSGAELAIWFIKYPSIMTAEGDIIFDNNPMLEPYWEALAAYAAYHIFVMEGDMTRAGQYSQIFTSMLGLSNQIGVINPEFSPSSVGTQYNKGPYRGK